MERSQHHTIAEAQYLSKCTSHHRFILMFDTLTGKNTIPPQSQLAACTKTTAKLIRLMQPLKMELPRQQAVSVTNSCGWYKHKEVNKSTVLLKPLRFIFPAIMGHH